MSDATLSEAIKEAYASAPADEVVYHTLEIRHSSFATPIRVVRDFADLDATLEADAPEDASTEVTFLGYAFDLVPPEVSAGGTPQLVIEIDNVSREILANIELAMASSSLLTVIYRAFLSSDLTAPANDPPLTLTIFTISANPMRIRAVAGFQDIVNKRFPSDAYTAERFPGLTLQ
jgi:hypothetical protein